MLTSTSKAALQCARSKVCNRNAAMYGATSVVVNEMANMETRNWDMLMSARLERSEVEESGKIELDLNYDDPNIFEDDHYIFVLVMHLSLAC